MKKHFFFSSMALMVIVLFCTLSSCSKDDSNDGRTPATPVQNNTLTASPSSLTFDAKGGSKTVAINGNTSWTVTSSETWVTPSTTQGVNNGSVTLTVTENTAATARTAQITIRYGQDGKVIVPINQEAGQASFAIDQATLSIDANGGTAKISVTSNVDWKASVDVTWLTLSTDLSGNSFDGSVNITASANPTTTTREAEITFTYGQEKKTCKVSQSGITPKLVVTPTDRQVIDGIGGGFTVSVTPTPSTMSWKISRSESWVKMDGYNYLDELSRTGSKSVDITIDENTSKYGRGAELTITSEAGTKTIYIWQEGTKKMALDDILRYPMGNIYTSMRISTYQAVVKAIKEKSVTLTEGTGSDNLPYFFLYASSNPDYKDYTYCGLSFHYFYGKQYASNNTYSYTFHLDKSQATSTKAKSIFNEILSDFNAISIPLKSDTSGSYFAHASATVGNYRYWISVSDASNYYSFDIYMQYK